MYTYWGHHSPASNIERKNQIRLKLFSNVAEEMLKCYWNMVGKLVHKSRHFPEVQKYGFKYIFWWYFLHQNISLARVNHLKKIISGWSKVSTKCSIGGSSVPDIIWGWFISEQRKEQMVLRIIQRGGKGFPWSLRSLLHERDAGLLVKWERDR